MTFKRLDDLADRPETGAPGPNVPGDGATFCAVHPTVETALRCNKCGRYMCTKCAVPTPVGYRCRQCVGQQAATFYKASLRDMILGGAIAFIVALPAAILLSRFLFLAIILSLPAGSLIGEAAFRAMGRRRARYMTFVVVGAIVAAVIVVALPVISQVISITANPRSRFGADDAMSLLFQALIPHIAFAILSAITAAGRVR